MLLLVDDEISNFCNGFIGKMTAVTEVSDHGLTVATIFGKGTQQISSRHGQW